MAEVILRPAITDDTPTLLHLIRALAEYEKLSPQFVFTEQEIQKRLLDENSKARAVIAEVNGTAVGFAIYFYNTSTFFDLNWMVLEAIYVAPVARKLGIGRHIFHQLASQAAASGCIRMEWSVLGWNQSAIDFYAKIGATPCTQWHQYRLEGDALLTLANPSVDF
jgi:GNAT superfamily N-acetyltransferase